MEEHQSRDGDFAFRIKNLQKHYDGFALGPLSLDLEPGRVLGFVGPNGSGKSTTLNCMMGFVRPDQGSVSVYGRPAVDDRPQWRADVGFVGERNGFFARWTVAENLKFLRRFYPTYSDATVNELSDRLELSLGRRVSDLSQGGIAKLALIAALAHSPKLLLLDEPTSSLDPVVRAEVLSLLFDLLADGRRSIFFSTHVLSDLGRLADELVFLHEGRLVLRSDKLELEESWRRITYRLNDPTKPARCVSSEGSGSDWRVISSSCEETLAHLHQLGAQRIEATRMTVDEISVEILRCAKKGIQP